MEGIQRNRLLASLNCDLVDKSVRNFRQIGLFVRTVDKCEKKCIEKADEWENGQLEKLKECANECEEVYRRVLEHQEKGCEITYFTLEKHVDKCFDLWGKEPEKLLECLNYKVGKLAARFGSYYLNQRANLSKRYEEPLFKD